jgi:hypothetical protein
LKRSACYLLAGLFTMVVIAATVARATADERSGEAIEVEVKPRKFAFFSTAQVPPGLTFLGGIELSSEHPDFGGFSGLEISRDGRRFLTVSDRGHWLSGRLVIQQGRLTTTEELRLSPMLDSRGKRQERKSRTDAEAVAAWNSNGITGKVIVGFERHERIELFDLGKHGFAARARRLTIPKAVSQGENNGEIEGIGRFYEGPLNGWTAIISERNKSADGSLRGWLLKGSRSLEFKIAAFEDYSITGLAVLPGGKEIVTVERSFTPPISVGMAIRRFQATDLRNPDAGDGELLFAGKFPAFLIDNMEGIAAHRDERGTILTLISDDNFNRAVQSTIIYQFRLN